MAKEIVRLLIRVKRKPSKEVELVPPQKEPEAEIFRPQRPEECKREYLKSELVPNLQERVKTEAEAQVIEP
jgi:hypothetical protein